MPVEAVSVVKTPIAPNPYTNLADSGQSTPPISNVRSAIYIFALITQYILCTTSGWQRTRLYELKFTNK
jgi:hypothetical protein